MTALAVRGCQFCDLEPEEAQIVREILRLRRAMQGLGTIEIRMSRNGAQLFRVRREEHRAMIGPAVSGRGDG